MLPFHSTFDIEQSGFGKADKQLYTDEEQAAKRMEQHDALSAQRDKVCVLLVVLVAVVAIVVVVVAAVVVIGWWW